MKSTRRKFLLSGLALGAAPLLGCPAIAQTRATLRVSGFGGLVEKTIREAVIPAMEKDFGTTVSYTVEYDNVLLPKLQVARSSAPYDVCMIDNDMAILGSEMGVWATDQSSKMSNIKDIYKSCKPPETVNYACQIYEYALAYNTDKIKAAPTSWNDVWTPGMVVAIPHVSVPYGLTFLYIAAILNGGSAANLDPGFAAIKRLGSFKVYKNVSQGLSLFQQKEVDLGLFYSHRALQMAESGLPIGRAFPKEGTWGSRSGLQIPRLTANMDGAIAFTNLMLSVPVQTEFAKGLYNPTNSKCVFSPDDQKRLLVGDHVDAVKELPWHEILPQSDSILDRWTREFGS